MLSENPTQTAESIHYSLHHEIHDSYSGRGNYMVTNSRRVVDSEPLKTHHTEEVMYVKSIESSCWRGVDVWVGVVTAQRSSSSIDRGSKLRNPSSIALALLYTETSLNPNSLLTQVPCEHRRKKPCPGSRELERKALNGTDEGRALDGENLRRALKKRDLVQDWSGKEGKTMDAHVALEHRRNID
ncbi:hypothetical protein TNCV_103251 [Trichonephila clavipes]|nr:hypothetical protein TNCV_103251 [Trichonephila clavipes]